MDTVEILNVRFHNLTRAELFAGLTSGMMVNPNVDVVMKMQHDPDLARICRQAEFCICDSQIVKAAGDFLGTPIKEKISGSDFFGEFCAYHRANPDIRIYLLGAGPGVAETARQRINARCGREVIVAARSPSFGFEKNPDECTALIDDINASRATVLAVGVGCPKQEKWIDAHRARFTHARIFLCVGATIDFEAGNVARAPAWMSRAGLEWAYRLWREPKRLARRYLIDDLPFLWLVLQQRMGRYRNPLPELKHG